MAKTYTYSEARQNLASVLLQADKDGEVIITHRNGRQYRINTSSTTQSPLDVPSLGIKITRQEIVDSVREGRETSYVFNGDKDISKS